MIDLKDPHSAQFIVHGDGRVVGDDRFAGELARMTLYVIRALAQIDGLLALGGLSELSAHGGPTRLDATINHDGDFGPEARCRLVRPKTVDLHAEPRQMAGSLATEIGYMLNAVTDVNLVAGCFLVSAEGRLLAERFPGVPADTLTGVGRRIKVARDAFSQLLEATILVSAFVWGGIVAAPVGNGFVVAVVDLLTDHDDVLRAMRTAGATLAGVDVGVFLSSHE